MIGRLGGGRPHGSRHDHQCASACPSRATSSSRDPAPSCVDGSAGAALRPGAPRWTCPSPPRREVYLASPAVKSGSSRYLAGMRPVLARRAARALALAGTAVLAGALARPSAVQAELDNQLFTSSVYRIKITVPKGWRPSELPSYPGIILWMLRSQPEGRIVVGTEPLRQELYCSWPAECRALSQPLAARYACALRTQLERQNLLMGPVQAGPKENLASGLPSVWFEFTDGKRYVRQALAANERRVVSFALSTGSAADRGSHARAFDQALRSLQELSEEEARPAAGDAAPAAGAPPPGTSSASSSSTPPTSPSTSGSPPAASSSTTAPVPTTLAMPLFDPEARCPGDTPPSPAPASSPRPR